MSQMPVQFNVPLRKNLCVSHTGNKGPSIRAQVDQSPGFEVASRCPKGEVDGQMVCLAEVMAGYDRSKSQIE
jgi:hypothetical protein